MCIYVTIGGYICVCTCTYMYTHASTYACVYMYVCIEKDLSVYRCLYRLTDTHRHTSHSVCQLGNNCGFFCLR